MQQSPSSPDAEIRVRWPRNDYSRIPYRLYHDPALYAAEQERIFKGAAWSYVGLEAELPKAGDYFLSYVGETPVIVGRDGDGALYVVVNRCAHRGAQVRREPRGNATEHVCIYHRWSYAAGGALTSVPFERGVKGQGGMPADFDRRRHGLRRLAVTVHAGVIFASFRRDVEPIAEWLGEDIVRHLDRLFARPLRILGYQRQRIRGNWKQYLENQRDTYHGSLLHEFQSTFGISRVTQTGGCTMDGRHRHNLTWAKTATDVETEFSALYKADKVHDSSLRLTDPSLVRFHPEWPDGISLAICGIFPNLTVHQISNSLATRQLRTFGPGEFELYWTLFGYQDDSEELTRHRLAQANMVGPAGLISMEDGEAIEITWRAVKGEPDAASIVEMGGRGPIDSVFHRVTDVSVRGFWAWYAQMMDVEPAGGMR